LSVLYKIAASGLIGSIGLGSYNNDITDKIVVLTYIADVHSLFNISRHIFPYKSILGWNIFVINFNFGGRKG